MRQKAQFRKYEADPATSSLSVERVVALREMGAIDSWSLAFLIRSVKSEARTWEESRVLLEAYRDAHDGCCNVPATWKDDPQLGTWVNWQKAQFRKYEADPATSSLSADRVVALREMARSSRGENGRRARGRRAACFWRRTATRTTDAVTCLRGGRTTRSWARG